MKRILLVIVSLLMAFGTVNAQSPQYGRFHKTLYQSAAPSTTPCFNGTLVFSSTTNLLYVCKSNAWLIVGVSSSTADAATPTSSYQTLAIDLTLGAASGKNVADGTAFLAPAMFNVFSINMTKTGNYVGASINHYNIAGTNATHYPSGAVLAGIGDSTTTAKGAVVAYIDGDGGVTTADAAFKVMHNNSTPGSGFGVGLDLADDAHDGFNAVAYLDGDIRLSNKAYIFVGAQTTRATVRAEVDAKVAHANVTIGSRYFSSAGKEYVKVADAVADTDWERTTTSAAD